MTGVMARRGLLAYADDMPISIGRLPTRATSSDPIDLLVECHDRIRSATGQARALSAAADGDPSIAATATAVHRYFAVALPLHSQDEDVSVAPRLTAAGLADADRHAVGDMTAQHADIDAVIARLLPLWARLAETPTSLHEMRGELARLTDRLARYWDEHLDLEERIVFPLLAARLDAQARAAIVGEMRARRATGRIG